MRIACPVRAWIVGLPGSFVHVDPAFARGLCDRFGSRIVRARPLLRACEGTLLGCPSWSRRERVRVEQLAALARVAGDLGRVRFEPEHVRESAIPREQATRVAAQRRR
jgi:hypothetical protein